MLVNAYCTHHSPPPPSFPHVLRSQRDRAGPEMAQHLNGFQGFVMQGGRKMTQTRYHVLCHIQRVRHQLAMEVEDAHLDAFAAWAREANAIVFLPDGTVRTPDGAVLVAPDTGDPEPGAQVPHPADAIQRKMQTDKKLAALGIPVARTLPPVLGEVELVLRDTTEVAHRCLGLLACAVRAESLASNEPITAATLQAKMPRAFASLTPRERAFMTAAAPSQQEIANHAWRYEALEVLRWALGGPATLPFPERICDVPALAKYFFGLGEAAFVAGARMRPAGELLDALDLVYRLHWAVTEARVHGGKPVPGVDSGVVVERHHALNWLTRFEDAEWDDVKTPT